MDEVSGRVGANASAMPIPERKAKISKYTLLRWRVIRDVTCRRRMARTLPRIPTRNLGLGLALHDSGLLGSSCSVSGRKTNYLAAEQETEECCRFGIGNPSLRHALRGGASSFFFTQTARNALYPTRTDENGHPRVDTAPQGMETPPSDMCYEGVHLVFF